MNQNAPNEILSCYTKTLASNLMHYQDKMVHLFFYKKRRSEVNVLTILF